jgi:hypothetical protein
MFKYLPTLRLQLPADIKYWLCNFNIAGFSFISDLRTIIRRRVCKEKDLL